jgi:signal transduction histidine kinase
VFASAPVLESPYRSAFPLEGWPGWRAQVAIRTGAAQELLVGVRAGSRVPLLLVLLVLTVALVVVALLQIRREHELAQLRADFTSSVSHELRTPLAQILLFGETLSLGRARSESERRLAAGTIVQEARRLMRLVDNLLLFARGRRPSADAVPRPIAAGSVVEAVAEGFAPLATAAGATLRADVRDAPDVVGDPAAIRQMLLNLLDNAIKYGPSGQTVRVSWEADGDRVRFLVDDDGPGVAPSDRERIWSPYVRLRHESHGARGGSGIGLAVVRELAESLGGRVWVAGAPGGGARFVVELQRAPERGPPPAGKVTAGLPTARHPASAAGAVSSRGAATPGRPA